jgi:hypothetical protein
MPVAPKALPKFKVSKQLRAIVNGSAGSKAQKAGAKERRQVAARKRSGRGSTSEV